MQHEFNRSWLSWKFADIQNRIIKALEQLNDEQVNWSPDSNSHSISTLIRHIAGNILERVNKGILGQAIVRDRDAELRPIFLTTNELIRMAQERLQFVIETINTLSDEQLVQTQSVRGKERSNLDMLHQCAAHYSEHMGQIFYIAKQLLKDDYRSTSI
ncbi:DinB family protein [Paenibacillus glycanilyticus]|uniref:DUF1572 domain-containing protein n=1 Tax=Paenibacillus glycanilyticus TaxID=126569 RepID=A0ABQ6GDA3_9BACL|nr:DinB family protein [Paenibacillus glycanilyticus]GLX68926.1 hypothetical protein MU1_32710 [Paenibacillus glycanilyticus]